MTVHERDRCGIGVPSVCLLRCLIVAKRMHIAVIFSPHVRDIILVFEPKQRYKIPTTGEFNTR